MITLGNNVKITAPESARQQVRDVFEALGASRGGPNDRMDVFATEDGGHIGFAYVPDTQALTTAQMRFAPWLELAVADLEATRERLEALGLARLDYEDKSHPYFVGPGGVVFRLTSAAR